MEERTLNVTFTETQMKALEQFISRVNLNAKEVQAFNSLVEALQGAVPTAQPDMAGAPEMPDVEE